MKKSVISLITALVIGFFSNAFAAQTETQVSPSAINLAAPGVIELTIHTEIPYAGVVQSTLVVYLMDAGDDVYLLPVASLHADSLGHMVVKIDWDGFLSNELPDTGRALFSLSGEYYVDGGVLEPFEGEDAAIIMKKSK